MNNVNFKSEWKRPFTNKRYLHPPFAENMFTMWPDFKVICGDIVEVTRGYRSSGFRILYGEELLSPDFSEVIYHTRPDGVPIHSISYKFESFVLHMESFCNIGRKPTCFTEFKLENTSDRTVNDLIAILPRTGREDHLVGMEVDCYAHYDSNVHNWGMLTSDWRIEGNLLTDGEYNILLKDFESFDLEWQGDKNGLVWYKRKLLKLHFTLTPGQSIRFVCAFRHGKVSDFIYHAEREKALGFWNKELTRLRRSPGGEKYKPLVNNIVLQCLQMFCYPVGKNYVLPRQGGLQRVIWPVEAIEFLIALDRLGDFRDYTETAYETFFFTLQEKEGENKGAVLNLSGNMWGSITGGSVWGCARHILYLDSYEVYEKFRDSLYYAFEWMEAQRSKTRNGEYEGVGLFPPMQSCDWPGVYQSWCLTDAVNLIGYRWLAEVFERFEDPCATKIRDAYNDYMNCMKAVLEREIARNDREDEIIITNKVGVSATDPPSGAYFSDGPAMLIRAGVIPAGSKTAKMVEAFFRNRGLMKNGLTGMMNDGLIFQGHNSDPWAGHTWYTSFPDMCWFYNWLESGEHSKAEETLMAQMKWGMSPEYYLLERYADNDPYWTPWMPNASANGRLLMMMSDFFEE
jgi:hypothetical protein